MASQAMLGAGWKWGLEYQGRVAGVFAGRLEYQGRVAGAPWVGWLEYLGWEVGVPWQGDWSTLQMWNLATAATRRPRRLSALGSSNSDLGRGEGTIHRDLRAWDAGLSTPGTCWSAYTPPIRPGNGVRMSA